MASTKARKNESKGLSKSPTGIAGFDDITKGGLPRGRPTLVCGGPGCGKTLFAMEFLVRGATQFNEPGVFVSFEELEHELAQNTSSLGFDLPGLEKDGKLLIERITVERSEIEETGEYDLEGLFVRIGYAIDSIGAKRIVLDTIEALFSGLANEAVLRSELRRLFGFLKQKGVTAVITGEKGEQSLTRQGLEEYVSDCVIFLDHRVIEQLSTRRLRVVKYRGTSHGTNEFPFLIDESGFSILPITAMGLIAKASRTRVSSGVPQLDQMLGGEGFFTGSTVMITGPAGSGKTSLAGHFVAAASDRGERCLYFSFEESPAQTVRNMGSIGLNLGRGLRDDTLKILATRPSYFGLEMHLTQMIKAIENFRPAVVVIDPLTDLISIGSVIEVKLMLARLIDYMKNTGVTALMTGLRNSDELFDGDPTGVSSLVDTWIMVNNVRSAGQMLRTIFTVKSRGMPHSNQIRSFELTRRGIRIGDVFQSELRGERARTEQTLVRQ